jgi:hypothetical protein
MCGCGLVGGLSMSQSRDVAIVVLFCFVANLSKMSTKIDNLNGPGGAGSESYLNISLIVSKS